MAQSNGIYPQMPHQRGYGQPLPAVPEAVAGGPVQESGLQRFGVLLVATYVFLVFARVPDLVAEKTGSALPIAMVISILAMVAAILSGQPGRLVKMPAVLALFGFTLWIVLTTPLSFWRGGTVEVLRDVWSKTLIVCVVIAILVTRLEHVRRVMNSLAYATLLIVAVGFVMNKNVVGRMTIGNGSLSNPNELALRLLIGLPFLLFVLSNNKGSKFLRGVIVLTIPVLLSMVLRTGSRSGLIAMAGLLIAIFLRATVPQKVGLMVLGGGLMLLLVVTLPKDAIDRFSVMFDTNPAGSVTEDQALAIGSKQARTALLMQSIEIFLSNPVFGVGAGVYAAAAAEHDAALGQRAMWHETHNTYTQIASEDGLPGLVLYLAALVLCMKNVFSVYRASRGNPEATSINNMAYCLFLALLAWAMGAFFDAQAYLMEFPMLAAITSVFILAAKPVLMAAPQGQPHQGQPMLASHGFAAPRMMTGGSPAAARSAAATRVPIGNRDGVRRPAHQAAPADPHPVDPHNGGKIYR
jgi:O-antigen ligase